jgi:hypothetical protein
LCGLEWPRGLKWLNRWGVLTQHRHWLLMGTGHCHLIDDRPFLLTRAGHQCWLCRRLHSCQCCVFVCANGDLPSVQVRLLWVCVDPVYSLGGRVANNLEHSLRKGYHPGRASRLPCCLVELVTAFRSVLCVRVLTATYELCKFRCRGSART